ncbi:hypothetical protein GCM10027036_03190 [Flavihumibacter cheonanensis]
MFIQLLGVIRRFELKPDSEQNAYIKFATLSYCKALMLYKVDVQIGSSLFCKQDSYSNFDS